MPRPPLLAVALAPAALLAGCGDHAHEDASAAATGVVVAQAPPGAVGADVERPPAPTPGSDVLGPLKKPSPPTKIHPAPLMPEPAEPDDGAPKGTEL